MGYAFSVKYEPGHLEVCPKKTKTQLNALAFNDLDRELTEEVLNQLAVEDTLAEEFCQLSLNALSSMDHTGCIKLRALVKSTVMLLLLDSGSSHSFVSSDFVQQVGLSTVTIPPRKVTLANGHRITVDKMDTPCKANMLVLDMAPYDAILGYDWLSLHSPMECNWADRTISFTLNGQSVQLQGLKQSPPQVTAITPEQVFKATHGNDIWAFAIIDSPVPDILQSVLKEYEHVFQEPQQLPPSRAYDHSIPLQPGATPFNSRPYRYSPLHKIEIEQQVQQLLKSGLLTHNSSPFASPVLLVHKKDGQWRFCVDYRKLNDLTIKNRFPLLVIEEILDELHGSCYFTKLDMRSGYHQIRMLEAYEYKTTFKTHQGHYQFKVMPFGLTNAPATFQCVMNEILQPFLRKFVLVFLDDILIYSPTLDLHVVHINQVVELLRAHQLYLKPSKCSFAQTSIGYLGRIISAQGVSTDPDKTIAIQKWPPPTTVTELRAFLGLTNYYRRFVKNYGILARPLTQLWSQQAEQAFLHLKSALTSTPMLALPNFQLPFTVETDACGESIGAVLMQQGQPIAFLSKGLSDKHKALFMKRNFGLNSSSGKYKQGKENIAADALSRVGHLMTTQTVAVVQHQWIQEVLNSYTTDSKAQRLIAQLAIASPNADGYSLDNGLIRVNGKIWIGDNAALRTKIISALHNSALGGHSGIQATYHRVQLYFCWSKRKQDVEEFVKQCLVCQQAKHNLSHPAGMLQPLPIPKRVWQDLSMDFIEGLPKSEGYITIMVVTIVSDRDPIFISAFWRELFKLYQVKLNLSTAYHPQSDGQTERVNQCLEMYLRCAIHDSPRQWKAWLPLAELWYNSSFHTSIGCSPFKALFGYEPNLGVSGPLSASTPPSVAELAQVRELHLQVLKQHLAAAQNRMKLQADRGRVELQFQPGDFVLLKLQPYTQSSVVSRPYPKLAFKYYGPFKVLERVGSVAYKLELPSDAQVHPVFHVSQLKPYTPNYSPVFSELPVLTDLEARDAQPVAILDRRLVKKGNAAITQIRVAWSGLPQSSATWEDYHVLKTRFPHALAWGQAPSSAGGAVTTSG
ncbi:LOW QUALITY PROTEIN: hypothetical protein U9M48_000419 [Paspalum notatum var. saurae]|uniref:Reverse transcriptase n=1 Tax=Paspalum notatum var. saurae TaxID=547442 RepID=A0AAQ3SFY2_PASNO